MKLTIQAEKPYGATLTIQREGLASQTRYSITKTPEGFDPDLEDPQEPEVQLVDGLEEADARLLLSVLTMLLGPEPQTVYSVGV